MIKNNVFYWLLISVYLLSLGIMRVAITYRFLDLSQNFTPASIWFVWQEILGAILIINIYERLKKHHLSFPYPFFGSFAMMIVFALPLLIVYLP